MLFAGEYYLVSEIILDRDVFPFVVSSARPGIVPYSPKKQSKRNVNYYFSVFARPGGRYVSADTPAFSSTKHVLLTVQKTKKKTANNYE